MLLHILPKLSNEHIKLTYYSKMNVRFPAQVLSSLSKVLLVYGPPEQKLQKQYAFFLLMMVCFFDIMDIWNTQSHKFDQKPMLAKFRSVNHWRFLWIYNVFPKSFQDWLNSVQQHQGNLNKRCWPENVNIVESIWRVKNKC